MKKILLSTATVFLVHYAAHAQTAFSRVLINNPFDDGITPLIVNGNTLNHGRMISQMAAGSTASVPQFYLYSNNPQVSDFEVYTNTDATFLGPYWNKPLAFVRNAGIESMRIAANGHVGIGTSTPAHRFVVSNAGNEGFEIFLGDNDKQVGLQAFDRVAGVYRPLVFYASKYNFLMGYVGIGTTNPQQNLVVSNNNKEGLEVYLGNPDETVGIQSYNRSSNQYRPLQYDASKHSFMGGKVGIGTTNPQTELAVNGTITAKRIKVTVHPTSWPDFVFRNGYRLPALSETEQFIKQHGHLPDIPSAAQVEQEGLDLGSLNSKLLQKIEELTLHLIEMEKQNKQMQQEIKRLNESVNASHPHLIQ